MTLRSSLVVFGIGSGFAWTAFLLILLTVPPEAAGPLGETFFFASLFVALTGTFTILELLGRVRRSALLPALHMSPSFRQGVLLSTAAAGSLVLQRFRVLRLWNTLLLVLALVIIDYVFSRGEIRVSAG